MRTPAGKALRADWPAPIKPRASPPVCPAPPRPPPATPAPYDSSAKTNPTRRGESLKADLLIFLGADCLGGQFVDVLRQAGRGEDAAQLAQHQLREFRLVAAPRAQWLDQP